MPVVEAHGTSAISLTPGLGRAIQRAQEAAILKANAEGISDPAIILERKLAARDLVKKEFAAATAHLTDGGK